MYDDIEMEKFTDEDDILKIVEAAENLGINFKDISRPTLEYLILTKERDVGINAA